MQRYTKPIVIVMVLAVISALFFALVPSGGGSGGSSPVPTTPSVISISVADGKVTGGGDITVKQGSRVIVSVTADVSDEVHIHGYDLKTNVTPNQPMSITFTATAAGKFEVELEEAALPLTEITVVP